MEGEAALAAARRALALVGDVGPALDRAFAATFLGERDETLVPPLPLAVVVGAGAGGTASFSAAASDVWLAETVSLGGAALVAGSGVLPLDLASKNSASSSALDVDKIVDATDATRWRSTVLAEAGSALSSTGVCGCVFSAAGAGG